MDLFENPINRNGKYVRPVEEDQREVLIPDLEQPEVLVEGMEMVDVSVLPRNLIEVGTLFWVIYTKWGNQMLRDVYFCLILFLECYGGC